MDMSSPASSTTIWRRLHGYKAQAWPNFPNVRLVKSMRGRWSTDLAEITFAEHGTGRARRNAPGPSFFGGSPWKMRVAIVAIDGPVETNSAQPERDASGSPAQPLGIFGSYKAKLHWLLAMLSTRVLVAA